jgi:non-heme chloroperoxidase
MNRRGVLHALMSGVGLAAVTNYPDRAEARTRGETFVSPPNSFVEARDGTRLFFQDWGSGPPLVFIAPWSLNSSWWEYQIAPLSVQGFRCVAPDRRGHGRSDQPGRGYDFDTLADDLATLLARLDLRNVTLVGHSMGCAEVVRYLSKHGSGRVARMILVSTITPLIAKTAGNVEGVDPTLLERGRATLSQDRAHQISISAQAFFGAPKNTVSAEIMEWWTRMMVDQCSLMTMLALHRVFTETDFGPDLEKVTVPTLLIHGDSDTSARIDLTSKKSVRLIAGSQLKVYEGAAHGLPITHMTQLNADIMSFAKS